MSTTSQQPTVTSMINPCTHLRNQFARRFIRALNNTKTTTGAADDSKQIYRRCRRVKTAAYTTMALIVGSRRAWSRALLWKMRNRSRNRGFGFGFGFSFLPRKRKLRRTTTRHTNKITTHHHHHDHAKVVSLLIKRRNPPFCKRSKDDLDLMGEFEWKLRKVVPGGETMDSWPLLIDETADYINCLSAQVQVMKTLVDRYT